MWSSASVDLELSDAEQEEKELVVELRLRRRLDFLPARSLNFAIALPIFDALQGAEDIA